MKLKFVGRTPSAFVSILDNTPPVRYDATMSMSGTREEGIFYIEWDLSLRNSKWEVVYCQLFISTWERLEIRDNAENIGSELDAEIISIEVLFTENVPEEYRHIVSHYHPNHMDAIYYLVHN